MAKEKLMLSVFGLIFAVIGVGLLAGSYLSYHREHARVKAWSRTTGIVTGLQEQRSKDSEGHISLTYAPIVEFTLPNGETHRFIGSIASYPPSHAEHQQVHVLYNPLRPSEADVDSFVTHWLLAICLLGAGIVCSLFAAVIIRNAKDASAATEISVSFEA
jgi:hypothetical protein